MESGRVKAFHPKERREGEASERFFDTQSVLDKLEIQIFFRKKAEGKFYFPPPLESFPFSFPAAYREIRRRNFPTRNFWFSTKDAVLSLLLALVFCNPH